MAVKADYGINTRHHYMHALHFYVTLVTIDFCMLASPQICELYVGPSLVDRKFSVSV